jgi:putative ABC transport system permease protein
MRFFHALLHGLRNWRRPDAVDRDLVDELEHFYAEAISELVRQGVPADEALRRVRQTYGDALAAREDVRASLWETTAQDIVADVRLGARRLRRSPGFTAIVACVLGLGIGAATLIMSVVRPVLFDGLGYPDADRLVALEDRSDVGEPYAVTFGTYVELQSRTSQFHAVAVHRSWQPTLTGRTEPERLEGQRVSARFFDVLGVHPLIGPGLDQLEDRVGGADQVVLSHRLWADRFGSDPEVLGRAIELDGVSYAVVGVMPAGFRSVVRTEARLWALLQYGSTVSFNGREWGHHLGMVGRLGRGVEISAARAELAEIAERPIGEFPRPDWAALQNGVVVTPLRSSVTADGQGTGVVLLGAAALLLVIACVNLAILLVARGLRRGNEISVRTALGAGRGRLVRQLTTESLLLAGLGGALGIGVAWIGIDATLAAVPASLQGLGAGGIDAVTISFSVAVTLAEGVAGGVIPALAAARGASAAGGSRSTTPARRVARYLIVAEVALAFVLLVGAGLLARTMQHLLAEPYGIEPANTVVMQVWGTSVTGGDESVHRFWDQSLDAIRAVPGVRSIATTTQLPLSGDWEMFGVVVDGTGRADGADGAVLRYSVSPDYHDLLGVPIREGRALAETDRGGAPPVAVVSASLARSLFGEGTAIGRQIRVGAGETAFTIVGVADDVRQGSLASDVTAAVYTTAHQWHWADRVRWVAVDLADPGLVDEVKRAVWSVDSDQSIVRIERLGALVRRSEARRRFVMTVIGIFAGFALLLSGLGLYGVLSSRVAERTREMGIRAALGATRPEIVRLVVGHGMGLSTVGIVIGVVTAMLSSRALASLLFGVSGLDPVTYVAVATLFVMVAGLACWVPARRAARVDPLRSLAAE